MFCRSMGFKWNESSGPHIGTKFFALLFYDKEEQRGMMLVLMALKQNNLKGQSCCVPVPPRLPSERALPLAFPVPLHFLLVAIRQIVTSLQISRISRLLKAANRRSPDNLAITTDNWQLLPHGLVSIFIVRIPSVVQNQNGRRVDD